MNSHTLNSVGTISLGVLSPMNISSPTNVIMDMKMEKSLMSFLSWSHRQRDTMEKTNSLNEKQAPSLFGAGTGQIGGNS